ncbi:Brix-domain-containing protein [Trichodelitschia bisporula]|uniref:Brix-domain-containing protein n=1 Tax=Trichodelitschia bisporula TaxID=703511 RepID=A0A6G1HR58_9PEZI|nr:Brix-domain-containing protein [Trichodelitschia bisporula]
MARRRVKKRTHVGAKNGPHPNPTGRPMDRTPKSMVIRIGAGEVGPSVSQLAKDVRQVMEPGTASRLKERKSNKLRDYTTMTGPLGVTHLLLFSRSDTGNTNMRLAITPRGPTLNFRVENYSLVKDILKAQNHPKTSKQLFLNAPLLVMNNFTTSGSTAESSTAPAVPKQLESLVTTVFQSLFPPLNPQSTPLTSIKRVLLLNREPPSNADNSTYTITLRHYAISSKVAGLRKPIRRINAAEKVTTKERKGKGVPNLGKLEDVADYLLNEDPGAYTSGSDSEPETDAEVEVLASTTKKIVGRSKKEKRGDGEGSSKPGVEKRAVKLTELGPRMRLRLIKVEEGLCSGKIMWHEYISKSKQEEKQMDATWDKRRKEKEERTRIQRENVERKRKEKASKKTTKADDADEYDEIDEADWDSDELEYVGAEDAEDEEMEDAEDAK